jgi:hypothetical protein
VSFELFRRILGWDILILGKIDSGWKRLNRDSKTMANKITRRSQVWMHRLSI